MDSEIHVWIKLFLANFKQMSFLIQCKNDKLINAQRSELKSVKVIYKKHFLHKNVYGKGTCVRLNAKTFHAIVLLSYKSKRANPNTKSIPLFTPRGHAWFLERKSMKSITSVIAKNNLLFYYYSRLKSIPLIFAIMNSQTNYYCGHTIDATLIND